MNGKTIATPQNAPVGGLKMNRRTVTILLICVGAAILFAVTVAGVVMSPNAYATNYSQKNQPPSASHLFGTDWMGRDMLARTVKGLSTSIMIGAVASSISAAAALILGTAAATLGRKVDGIVTWLIDLCQGIPHMVLLMLVCIAAGRGARGVLIGVAVTHWPGLSRIIRAEVMEIRSSQYVLASRKMGKSTLWIAAKHMLPHLIPQFVVGLILLFPHAILHEASITFLGFGLPPEQPAVGVILSEAMKYLSSGMWWLTVLPGVTLVAVVMLFDTVGDNVKALIDPYSAQE